MKRKSIGLWLGIILLLSACGSSTNESSNEGQANTTVTTESNKESKESEEVVEKVEDSTQVDDAGILTTLHGYFQAEMENNGTDMKKYLIFNDEDEKAEMRFDRTLARNIEDGYSVEIGFYGVNIFNIIEREDGRHEAYILFGKHEIVYQNDETNSQGIQIDMNAGELVWEDDMWKILDIYGLRNIHYNGILNADTLNSPQAYIVDYAKWFHENPEVQVDDRLFYEIQLANYEE